MKSQERQNISLWGERDEKSINISFKLYCVVCESSLDAISGLKCCRKKRCLALCSTGKAMWCFNVGGPENRELNRCIKSCVLTSQALGISLGMRECRQRRHYWYIIITSFLLSKMSMTFMCRLQPSGSSEWSHHAHELDKIIIFVIRYQQEKHTFG